MGPKIIHDNHGIFGEIPYSAHPLCSFTPLCPLPSLLPARLPAAPGSPGAAKENGEDTNCPPHHCQGHQAPRVTEQSSLPLLFLLSPSLLRTEVYNSVNHQLCYVINHLGPHPCFRSLVLLIPNSSSCHCGFPQLLGLVRLW